jgi:hypothetical protein
MIRSQRGLKYRRSTWCCICVSEYNISPITPQSSSCRPNTRNSQPRGESSTLTDSHTRMYEINAINYNSSLKPASISKKNCPCNITTNSVSIPFNKSWFSTYHMHSHKNTNAMLIINQLVALQVKCNETQRVGNLILTTAKLYDDFMIVC